MNILYLGIKEENIIQFLHEQGEKLHFTNAKISFDLDIVKHSDFIISYRYRHILKKDILNLFPNKVINIHISLLPYNKGADPNLWSFLENTPKGVTIHYLDEGIDTGDIIIQQEVNFSDNETLKTSYDKLSAIANELFIQNWKKIKNGEIKAIPQINKGTLHYKKDKKRYEHLLINGWDTSIKDLIGKGLINKREH